LDYTLKTKERIFEFSDSVFDFSYLGCNINSHVTGKNSGGAASSSGGNAIPFKYGILRKKVGRIYEKIKQDGRSFRRGIHTSCTLSPG